MQERSNSIHWSYVFLASTHRYDIFSLHSYPETLLPQASPDSYQSRIVLRSQDFPHCSVNHWPLSIKTNQTRSRILFVPSRSCIKWESQNVNNAGQTAIVYNKCGPVNIKARSQSGWSMRNWVIDRFRNELGIPICESLVLIIHVGMLFTLVL